MGVFLSFSFPGVTPASKQPMVTTMHIITIHYYYSNIIIIKRGLKKVRVTRTSYESHDSYIYLFIHLIQFSQLTLTLDLEKPGLICYYNLLL